MVAAFQDYLEEPVMPTSIAEPLHLSVLVLCGLITSGIWSRAHVRYQQFLTLSLVSILIAETMKSTAVTDWIDRKSVV